MARDLLARFRQPVLVEEFLPGREFTVGITGTGDERVRAGHHRDRAHREICRPGYGYENKSDWEGKLDIVPVDDAEARAAGAVALAAWRVLRCRDGGRADIRLDRDGKPRFIEVNPLAGIRPGYSDLCFIADFQKVSYQRADRQIPGFLSGAASATRHENPGPAFRCRGGRAARGVGHADRGERGRRGAGVARASRWSRRRSGRRR